MIFFSLIGSPEVRFYATIHDDNSHSEIPQRYFEHVLVEKGSTVTLTCQCRADGEETQIVANFTLFKSCNCENVKTCYLTLQRPVANRKYSCRVPSKNGPKCFYQELEVKVAGESRVLKVSIYYHYYYYYYYYYIIIIIIIIIILLLL